MTEGQKNGWPENKKLFERSLDEVSDLQKRVSKLEIGQAVIKSRLVALVTIIFMIFEMVFRGAFVNLLEIIFK